MSPGPPLRLPRALAFAVVCVTLTVAGHVTASRAPVPPHAVIGGGIVVLAVAWVLAGHQRSPLTILGGLVGGQFGLHALFASAQPSLVHGGHGHAMAGPDAGAAPSTPGMSLAHLIVAAVLAWWMWRGEKAVWELARRLAARAFPLLALPDLAFTGPVRLRALTVLVAPVRPPLRHSLASRAPPFRSPAVP